MSTGMVVTTISLVFPTTVVTAVAISVPVFWRGATLSFTRAGGIGVSPWLTGLVSHDCKSLLLCIFCSGPGGHNCISERSSSVIECKIFFYLGCKFLMDSSQHSVILLAEFLKAGDQCFH